jgi:plasmid stabilization system protein ParE
MLKIIEKNRAANEVEYIASNMTSLRAAATFVEEVRQTYQRIASMPALGNVIEELAGTKFAGVRLCTVKKFRNYIVIYSFDEAAVTIHHVFDGRRHYTDLFVFE